MKVVDLPLTLTVTEGASLLGISRNSAYAAIRRGEIPTLRLGRRLVIPTARLLTLPGVGPEVGEHEEGEKEQDPAPGRVPNSKE